MQMKSALSFHFGSSNFGCLLLTLENQLSTLSFYSEYGIKRALLKRLRIGSVAEINTSEKLPFPLY